MARWMECECDSSEWWMRDHRPRSTSVVWESVLFVFSLRLRLCWPEQLVSSWHINENRTLLQSHSRARRCSPEREGRD